MSKIILNKLLQKDLLCPVCRSDYWTDELITIKVKEKHEGFREEIFIMVKCNDCGNTLFFDKQWNIDINDYNITIIR